MDFDALSASVTKQGSLVRSMKKSGAPPESIAVEVEKLKSLKASLAALSPISSLADEKFIRKSFDEMLVRKFFVVPAFEIHGGVAGLFDLGPPGSALKTNIIDVWRKHFVLNEGMLEMECTNLTPANVLTTSGHVERFTDLMVKDPETGECYRADKLLEDAIDNLLDGEEGKAMSPDERVNHQKIQLQADAFSPQELGQKLKDYGVKTIGGKEYGEPYPFNLMFRTMIGPEGTAVGYLRPETAQGLFVNFKRLIDYNAQKMPFAAAQIGLGFRNEISPKAGLLRVREFCMAEIEHFVNPEEKDHHNFNQVAKKELTLFGKEDQLGTGKTRKVSIGDAVSQGLVANQTLGYFMARTQLFAEKIGLDKERLRFRQHLDTEMAHYACDCCDLEIKTSYGWIECAGHADRSCYDLQVHGKATNTDMVATKLLDKPVEVEFAKIKFDRKKLGMVFKGDARKVSGALEALGEEDIGAFEELVQKLDSEGKATFASFEITKDMFTYEKKKKKIHEKKFVPSVVEPSFGIGRILYALLEHSFDYREKDEQRIFMKFNCCVAPVKCAALPISGDNNLNKIVDGIVSSLTSGGISCRSDKSGASLGRRYARMDEIGVPFCFTCDFETLAANTVTMRDRDTMLQVRLPIDELEMVMNNLVSGRKTFEDLKKIYPVVSVADGEEGEKEGEGEGENAATFVEQTARGRFSRPKI